MSIRLFALICLLSGCGYEWHSQPQGSYGIPTISVPYVSGDADGSLTAEIVRALVTSGVGEVRQWGAQYTLQVAIHSAQTETTGYRRDRQQISGESKKNLLAAERRKTVSLQVTLYDSKSDEIALGPFNIEASSEFDYVDGDSIQDLVFIAPNGTKQVVLPFSLGQLESSEAAEEAAMRPLYVNLARKIVEALYAGLSSLTVS